ncbi:monocarboxylate transporter 12-B-like [Babylonia areolata]|uniref:monocarboxylate transporter 12-B-like n=1 Tax=Babylonia areolata TaxID=304850 RepID=UPI003FD613CA
MASREERHELADDVRQSRAFPAAFSQETPSSPGGATVGVGGSPHHFTAERKARANVSAAERERTQSQGDGDGGGDGGGGRCDGGWGWMVAVGVFVNYVLVSGYIKSSGLIFVELMDRFHAPASRAALLFSVRYASYSIGGFITMNVLLIRFGARRLALLGGLFLALSAILSSLANNLTILIGLQGLLLGLGHSMLISPGQVLIGRYFSKWRNLALGFTECGVSVGNLAVPPLMSYFLEVYALPGTLLLYGGICLNSLVAAMLLRPVSYYSKQSLDRLEQNEVCPRDAYKDEDLEIVQSNDDPKQDSTSGVDGDFVCDFSTEKMCLNSNHPGLVVELDELDYVPLSEIVPPQNEPLENCQKTIECGRETLLGNKISLQDSMSKNQSCCDRVSKWPVLSLLNFSVFKDSMFYVLLSFSCFSNFVNLPVDYLPALVSQHGVSESQAALLLSVIGVLDLVCRITCGVVSSSERVNVTTLVLLSYVVLAVVMQFVRYMERFEHFVVLAAVQGFLGSVGNCLFPQTVLELVGMERMAAAVGWNQLTSGALIIPVYPLLGYVQDVTGSYVIVYHLIGIGMLMSGVTLCFVRPVRHCQRQNRNTSS